MKTPGVYYDGSEHLNALHINCDTLSTNYAQCIENPHCGWCGDKHKCIDGTSRGPLAPCLRSTYLFNFPTKNWHPLRAGTINIDGQEKLKVTHNPDFTRARTNVYNR